MQAASVNSAEVKQIWRHFHSVYNEFVIKLLNKMCFCGGEYYVCYSNAQRFV